MSSVRPDATSPVAVDQSRSDRLRLWALTLLAWAVGLSGAVASIRGWGVVVMFGDVQRVATTRLAFGGAIVVALMTLLRGFPHARLLVVAVTVPAMAMATATNAGRLQGAVAALSLAVAHLALVDRGTDEPGRPGTGVAVWALPSLVGAQVLWCATARIVPTVALLGTAGALVLLHRRDAALLRTVREGLRRSAGPLRRSVTAVERWRIDVGDALVRAVMQVRRRWRRRLTLGERTLVLLAAGGASLLSFPVFWRFVSTPSAELGHQDFENHLWWASQIEFLPPRLVMPHPMLHLPTAALGRVVGPELAMALLVSLAVGLTVVVLARVASTAFAGRSGLNRLHAVGFALALLVVESPSVLANAFEWGNPNDWTATNHMYLSPTETLLIPLALLLLFELRWVILATSAAEPDRPAVGLLAVVTVATMLTKPTVPVVLLAVLPAYLLVTRRLTWDRGRVLLVGFVVPVVALMVWQVWLVRSGGAIEAYGTGGFEFAPLGTIRTVGLDNTGPLLLTPLLVVPLCLWAGARRYLREPAVVLSLGALAVSLVVLFLFQETGPRADDGNFTKPAFASWVLLNTVSWRYLAGELAVARRMGRWPVWAAPAAAMLLVGVAAGLFSYLDALGVVSLTPQGTVLQ